MNLAKSLFQYALDNEYLDKNPVIAGLIPPKKGNQREQRLPFTASDLKRIFAPETFDKWVNYGGGFHPERYWLPKLALWTGGRLEELASLHCCDVIQVGDIWSLDHNFNNGRQLKNENAVRTIPLHHAV